MNCSGYENFLRENMLTENDVQRLMQNLPVPQPCEEVDSAFMVAPSKIHGVGMFAKRDISKGESFPGSVGDIRYNLARYVNHSDIPNAVAYVRKEDGEVSIWCRVISDIGKGEELTMDYNGNMAVSIEAYSLPSEWQS